MFTLVAVISRILLNPLGNVFQKKLTAKSGTPVFVNFITYLLLSICSLFFVRSIDWSCFSSPFWIYVLLVGMIGALGNFFLVTSVKDGELSICGPINAYKSVIALIFGMLFLGEFPNLWGCLGIGLIIVGSFFVLDASSERFIPETVCSRSSKYRASCDIETASSLGYLRIFTLFCKPAVQFRFYAMFCTAIEAIFIKKVILYSNPVTSMITWCWGGTFFSGTLLLLIGHKKFRHDIIQFGRTLPQYAALVLCVGLTQLATNYAFRYIPVGYALALFQLSAIVSILFGYRFFQESNLPCKLFGTVIMILGSLAIILLK